MGLRGQIFLILITLHHWKKHFWEKNYIKITSTYWKVIKVLKLFLKNVEETTWTVSKHAWVCRCFDLQSLLLLKECCFFSENSLKFQKIFKHPATSLEGSLWHRCFPVNFVQYLRAAFLRLPRGNCFLKLIQNYETLKHDVKCNHVLIQPFYNHIIDFWKKVKNIFLSSTAKVWKFLWWHVSIIYLG